MADESGTLISYVLGMLLKKIIVPFGFHDRVKVIKAMQEDDVSGLVDSLTDFSVDSANVDFSIETNNPEFSKILRKWLNTINSAYRGKIPSGLKPLAKEYFKERWKYSSFPVLKIVKWDTIDKILVPTKMAFVDGGSIYAEDVEAKDETLKLISYNYFLGKDSKTHIELNNNCIFSRPYGRWFDKYPTPYLIKRGVYHNFKIIDSIKNMETKILDQIIPYMMLVKKGTAELAKNQIKTYSNEELNQIITDLQDLTKKLSENNTDDKTPIRATNFDEEIKHLIPDLKTIFQTELFASAEKNILTGLGFIDIAEAVSSSRRESILNPKVFIEECRTGVEDFKQIMKDLVFLIIEKNKDNHPKYINTEFYITASAVTSFMTNDFKNQMRLLWERGQLSNQTYCEVVGEVEYRTELTRREKEAKNGDEYTMYPHLTKNDEDKGIDIVGERPEEDVNGNPIDTDKIDDPEKYNIGMIIDDKIVNSEGKLIELEEGIFLTAEELELEKAYVPRITKNYIRLRQVLPSKFQKRSFRTITLSATRGIKAIVGRLIGEKTTTIQSYLFDKTKWTIKEAQTWVEQHKQAHAKLFTAPYTRITELPNNVKKKLSPSQQRKWMTIFNNAYNYMLKKTGDTDKAETYAFRVAWSQVRATKRKKSICTKTT